MHPVFHRLTPFLVFAAAGCASAPQGPPPPPASAAPELRAARALDPDNPNLGWRLASALRAGGRQAEAREVLDETLARDPDHVPALHLLGVVLEELGDDGGAAAVYDRALALPASAPLRDDVESRLAAVRRRILEREVRAAVEQESMLADTPPLARTVAVFPFEYRGGEARLAPLGRALSHMLVTDLGITERLTVLERLEVQRLADELALTEAERVDPTTGVRAGRILGAERVVQGQILSDDDDIRIEAGILASNRPEDAPVRVEAAEGLERFFEAEAALALGLFDAMGIELTAAEAEQVGRRRTASLEALLAFGLGLEAQDEGRYEEALGHFERAVELDPAFEDAADAVERTGRLLQDRLLDPEAFAALGARLLVPTELERWLARRTTYRGVEVLLPSLGGRDPWAEVLDREGLSPGGATVIIVLPRPGGRP